MKKLLMLAAVILVNFVPLINAQWVQTNGLYGGVSCLTVSPNGAGGTNLFAGTLYGGVFLSTNNGTSWKQVNNGLTDTLVTSLAVSPNGAGGTNLFAGTEDGVFLSTNNGTSWKQVNTGWTDTANTGYTAVLTLAVSPNGAGGTNLFAGTYGSGVFLSTNNGTSWTQFDSGLMNIHVCAIAVSGTNLFVGTYYSGIFLSTNNGTSWAAVNNGLTDTYVSSLVVSGTNLLTGTGSGVFLSTNNGTSWTEINSGLTDTINTYTDVDALAVSGTNLFAGTHGSGVFLSTNNGTNWTKVNSGRTNSTVNAFAISGTNLFAGASDGVWKRSLSEMINGAEIPFEGLQLWLKSDAGIVANNGRVSKWMDQSGNGNDAIETDTSRQPVLVNNELNGKPVISFDGVNDRLGFTGSKKMSQVSVFAVLKNKTPDVNSDAVGSVFTFGPGGTYNASEHLGLRMRGFPPGNNNDVVVGTGDGPDYVLTTSTGLSKYNEWRNISFVTDEKLFNTTLRWNGNDAVTAPSGTNLTMSVSLGDSAARGGGIGSTDNFGLLGYPMTMAKCDFAEFIVYDTVLSNSDRLAVEKYLNDKYKITTPAIPTAGLQLWLKSDAGIIANKGRVSKWMDQSGNGNDAIETDTSRQPVLVNNELNGKPVISFDGVNDRLGFTGSKKMSQVSVFAVLKNKTPDVNSDAVGSVFTFGPGGTYNASEHLGLRMRGFPPGNNNDVVVGTGDGPDYVLTTSTGLSKYNEWRNISFVTDEKLFNTTLRWNGNDAVTAPSGTNLTMSVSLGDSAARGGGIGSTDNFGLLGYPITMAKCDFAEFIVYDTVLSNSDRLAVEKYLNDKFNITITGIADSKSESIPAQFTLYQNYPNPFNPSTTIKYSLPKASFVTLKVYDMLGREVTSLVNEEKTAGNYQVVFNASSFASGVYFYRIETAPAGGQAGGFTATKKLLLLK